MNAEAFVKLVEEMIDLKIQKYAAEHLKPSADVAMLLQMKRESDRRRLEQIRLEMARTLMR